MSSSAVPPALPVPIGYLRRFAASFKLVGILLLALLLQIPLFMIQGLLNERRGRQSEAVAEITQTWGAHQTLVGPILVVPYTAPYAAEKHTVVEGRVIRTTEEKLRQAHAYFLPERLKVTSSLEPEIRKRGIHEAVVYRSRINLEGRFAAPDVRTLDLDPSRLRWDQAWVAIGVTDLRGSRETLRINWNNQDLPLEPSTRIDGLASGLHARIPAPQPGGSLSFDCELALNGSGTLSFAPVGQETDVHLTSPWPDPSFMGAALPAERTVDATGFTAQWRSSYYARNYPQLWLDAGETETRTIDRVAASAFGVNLQQPVDSYRPVERAAKYGVLFTVLLFTAFFLFEVMSALRLHTIHYLLVGVALCLFYLALLSLSEFTPFPVAYACAAAASTLLIGGYCRSILKSGARALFIVAALVGIHGLLYFILQMQDYALLAARPHSSRCSARSCTPPAAWIGPPREPPTELP